MSEFPSSLVDPDQSDLARCPTCAFDVPLDSGVVLGETLWCGGCGVELVVASTEPLRLDIVTPNA